jgi:hypothetical protein
MPITEKTYIFVRENFNKKGIDILNARENLLSVFERTGIII